MGWREDMCPVLFAAHFDPFLDGQYWLDDEAVLTMFTAVFQPMISLFILYYLDTRTTSDDPMPLWMVPFGMTYTRSGMMIWGHCPWFRSAADNDKRGSGWSAHHWQAAHMHDSTLRMSTAERGPLLGTLNHIQGHCKYVLEQLRAWEGYDRAYACELLMA